MLQFILRRLGLVIPTFIGITLLTFAFVHMKMCIRDSCKNGAANVLTKDIPTSRLGNGCAGNTALAWLEKYTGPALPLTAFDPPASA